MGDIKALEAWSPHVLAGQNGNQEAFYYFTREMKTSAVCLKLYKSHIFIKAYRTQDEMKLDWKRVNYYIAMHFQSKVKEIIEKSNFYLCFFVADNVSIKIRNVIEGDSFCAKKYIFLDNCKTWPENLQEIENKIFSLHVPVLGNGSPKLRKLELQNFRGYAGNITVNFGDCRKRAASFIAVYAKNGVGKTSLFDGVEYALKGEVGRIASLMEKDKNDKLKGPIYHNRTQADQDAYVSMELENGKQILRKVAKIAKGGNDYRTVPAKKGKEITGSSKEKDKWDLTILPHDKIDSFISAQTPVRQYQEWVNAAAPLKGQTCAFEESYTVYRDNENKLQKISEAYEKMSLKLEGLSKERGIAERFLHLIESYNKLVQADKRLYFEGTAATAEQYNEVVDLALIYSRKAHHEKIALDRKIALAEEVLAAGVSSCAAMISSIKEIEKTLNKLELQIQRKKQLDILLQEYKAFTNKFAEYRQELELLQAIGAYGFDKVKEGDKKYSSLEKRIIKLKDRLEWNKKEQYSVLDIYEKAELKKKKFKLSFLSDEEFEEVYRKAEDIEKLNEEIRKVQIRYDVVQEKEKSYQQSMDLVERTLDEIRQFALPMELSGLKAREALDRAFFLKGDRKAWLFELEESYKELSIQRSLYQEEVSRHLKNNQLLKEINQKGTDYLNAHRETVKCPLCHTPFSNWEALFASISNIQDEDDKLLKRQIAQNQESIKQVEQRYTAFLQECEEIRGDRIAALKSEAAEWKKKMDACIDEKLRCRRDKEAHEKQVLKLKIWFIQKDIHLEGWSFSEIELWRLKQAQKQELYEKELKEAVERKGYVQRCITDINESISKLTEQKVQIEDDVELYRYIEFYRKQPDGFDYYVELDAARAQMQQLETRKKRFQNSLDQYKDVVNTDLESAVKLRDVQIESLAKLRELKAKYSIFESFSEEGVKKSRDCWTEKKNYYGQQEEYLKQISEESGARNYFENYQKCCQELKEKKAELEGQELKTNTAKKDFLEKKRVLEEDMRSYFGHFCMNEIFQKMNPHDFMKNVEYHLSFNAKDEPQLRIHASGSDDEMFDSYRPEWYFSTAQLNTVAFSAFFNRALTVGNKKLGTIFIDDPIGHFDDMNVLGFVDLLRSIFETSDCQIIMSTHDEKVFRLLERKLNPGYYSSCFIRLPEDKAIKWKV